MRGLQAGIEGAVSLALVGTLADTHIVDVLQQFAGRSKDVRLELRTASSREVTDLVRRGEATLGLRYFSSDRPEFVSLDAGSEAMLVVAAPGHRLAGRRIRQARQLAGERWVGFPPTPGERDSGQVLARQLIRAGLEGADVTLIDSLTAQKRLAQAGFGLALVPESSVRDELRQGTLVALDIPAMRTTHPDHRHTPPQRLSEPRRQGIAGAAGASGSEGSEARRIPLDKVRLPDLGLSRRKNQAAAAKMCWPGLDPPDKVPT